MPQNQQQPSEKEKRVHEIYEWVHILNDLLIGLYFLAGSIFFFYPQMKDTGVWLFVLGSAQMLAGPVIRTFNKIHVKHIRKKPINW